jgi:hypothetical protein
MEELGHGHVDILNIDVPNTEWSIMYETNWHKIHVGQILIHLYDPSLQRSLDDIALSFIGRLEGAGFLTFASNAVCGNCTELQLSLIHRGWRPNHLVFDADPIPKPVGAGDAAYGPNVKSTARVEASANGPKAVEYDKLEKMWDDLDAYTQIEHPDFGDRKWGIASIGLYAQAKTRLMYEEMVKEIPLDPPPVACELGFMAGHTALMFLEVLPTSTVYSFDLNDNPWTQRNVDMLKKKYGKRLEFIPGDSMMTIPEFKKTHPGVSCDVLMIDGSKDGKHRIKDMRTFRSMSHAGAQLFLDEVNNEACVRGLVGTESAVCFEGLYHSPSQYAYNVLSKTGELVVGRCTQTKTWSDGYCSAYFGNVVDNSANWGER